MLLTSELIDAKRALEIGLVNRVIPANELENAAQKIAAAILQGAPGAIANSKRLIEELWSSSIAATSRSLSAITWRHGNPDEAKEGIAAFLERRAPKWAD